MALVTLNAALLHLKLPNNVEDEDLERKIEQASAIVLDYLARPDDAAWTATLAAWDEFTVPADVESAVLIQLGELYAFRGDDPAPPPRQNGYLSPTVVSLLARRRDPVAR